jgi:oligopeptidase B
MTPESSTGRGSPPVARRERVVRRLHGVDRVDDYAWMRDTASPELAQHLAAERSWYETATDHCRSLVEDLATEMASRVPPFDRSVSWRRQQCSYYTQTLPGSEYLQLLRSCHQYSADSGTESVASGHKGNDIRREQDVLLDLEPLARESGHLDVGVLELSPDEQLLAYSVDTTGEEIYRLHFRDLATGSDLDDVVPRTYYTGAWSADSRTFFYTVPDAAYRPWQVWRHRLGTPAEADELVLAETDERFELQVRATRSSRFLVLTSRSRDTSHEWLIDATAPQQAARLVQPGRVGVEYAVEHAVLGGHDMLLSVTNDTSVEFRLVMARLTAEGTPDRWTELIAGNDSERLHRVDAFAGALVLSLRSGGTPLLRVLPLDADGVRFDAAHDVGPGLPAGRVALARNERWDVGAVTVVEQSAVHPPTWWDVRLSTGERTLRHRQDAPGHDPDRYVTERRFIPSDEGTRVPVTVTRHRDTPLDGSAPALLWGYGAYESCDDPQWDPALPSLLDRGVVHVHTHVRGGGELGRGWWLDGRLQHKQHTFGDHIAVADHLAATGAVDPERMATRGLSAGGLLQGAVFSQRPDRWRAVVAEVPFVDVVTTMLDPSIPLTVTEWDEWGDPRRAEDFAWMLSWSPYDNVPPAGGRPDLLVTGALHDPRVMVHEPAKWVAALRHSDPQWSPRCLFRCETAAGAHTGPSGRYAHLRYEAEVAAWVLDRLGLADEVSRGSTTPTG